MDYYYGAIEADLDDKPVVYICKLPKGKALRHLYNYVDGKPVFDKSVEVLFAIPSKSTMRRSNERPTTTHRYCGDTYTVYYYHDGGVMSVVRREE